MIEILGLIYVDRKTRESRLWKTVKRREHNPRITKLRTYKLADFHLIAETAEFHANETPNPRFSSYDVS